MTLLGDDETLGSDKRLGRAAMLVVAMAFRASPMRATLLALVTASSSLGSAASALALRLVVNDIVRRDVDSVVIAVALLALVSIATSLTSLASFVLRMRVVDDTQLLLDLELMKLSTGMPSIEHHERSAYVDQIDRIRERRGQLASSIGSIVSVASAVISLLGVVGALASVHPALLLLPLFGVPSFVLGGRGERLMRGVWENNTERYRSVTHLFNLATTSAPGKELRIFGTGGLVTSRHDALNVDTANDINHAGRQYAVYSVIGWTIFSLAYVGVLLFVVSRVIGGHGTPGDVALVLSLGSQVNEVVGALVSTMSWAMQSLDIVRRFQWLRSIAADADCGVGAATVPDRLVDGIRLEDVGFRYPGTDVDVLAHVDLHLPAGSTVAIVGDNGAGKSTLVKLLCRFYEPTSGRITIDGTPLADLSPSAWRQATSAAFQDYAKFELRAGETIGVGDLPHVDDVDHIVDALERASATDVIEHLEHGLDTQLGKSFTDGVELSGGQWQKLALARGMMRAAPLLLLLDEPTAAIDAETEHALFQRFTGTAKEAAARNGAITVLVSHRFSTVRMADLIVVVDEGGIVEVGPHHVLMGRGGLYAELYELQASGYR